MTKGIKPFSRWISSRCAFRGRIRPRSTKFAVGGVVVAVAMLLLPGCEDGPAQRDLNDATAPDIKLTVTASSTTVGGLTNVAPGSTVTLTPPGGSAFIEATDDDGVSWVELWWSRRQRCGNDESEQRTPGQLVDRVEGTVTNTEAPTSLTVGIDINLLTLAPGCTYSFEVWGKSANAASNPVESKSSPATLVLTLP